MTFSAGWRYSALFLGLAVSVIATSGARAQVTPPGAPMGTGRMATGQHGGAEEKPEVAMPDAVPGAKARAPAAPATKASADMTPTDALFDAINRGDIGTARDALNRGADMNGVNVLGMTPMELSVDLGRNDISFLLLSMRGEDSGRGSRVVAHRTDDAGAAGKAPKTAAKPAVAAKPVAQAAKPAQVATKPVATPKLFANDGGTPMPNAGFLGFDSHSATN